MGHTSTQKGFQMSCGIAPKTAALDRQLHFILGGVRCLKALRKQLLAARHQRELQQGDFLLPLTHLEKDAPCNQWLLKSALMPGYQLARYSSLHRAQARTMEELSIREMLFGTWKVNQATGRKDKALGGCETFLFHTDGNQDLQPLKGLSTLAQLQPTQANHQTALPRHEHFSLRTVTRDAACISLT